MNAPCPRTASIRRTGRRCLFAQPGRVKSDVRVAGGVANGVILGAEPERDDLVAVGLPNNKAAVDRAAGKPKPGRPSSASTPRAPNFTGTVGLTGTPIQSQDWATVAQMVHEAGEQS